jgi:hypothetical protein
MVHMAEGILYISSSKIYSYLELPQTSIKLLDWNLYHSIFDLWKSIPLILKSIPLYI